MSTPQWALDQIQDAREKKLTTLYLNAPTKYRMIDAAPLTEIPDILFELQQLTILELKNNQLTNLPDSISKLHNLSILDLSHNQLATLPNSIIKLQNLTGLY